MNFGDSSRTDADSFPSFFSKVKTASDRSSPEDWGKREDKIRLLEDLNKKLQIDIEENSTRFQREKTELEQKISKLEQSESALKEELQEIRKGFSRLKPQGEKHLLLESQVEYLSKENKRASEQYKIDKENWELQLESFKKGKTEDSLKLSILLSKAESKISSLISEVEELKEKNENQKNKYQQKLEYLQAGIAKLKLDEENYIKDLENKNKDNQEIIHKLSQKIKDFEKKTEKKIVFSKKAEKNLEKSLSLSEKLSKSSKSFLAGSPRNRPLNSGKRSSSRSKHSSSNKNVRKKPPSRDLSVEKNNVRVQNKVPSYLRKENQSNNIEKIEKEIAVLTGRYKYLVQMSQEASELQSLRTEVSKVASEIEEKSNQLFGLKKKQKEF